MKEQLVQWENGALSLKACLGGLKISVPLNNQIYQIHKKSSLVLLIISLPPSLIPDGRRQSKKDFNPYLESSSKPVNKIYIAIYIHRYISLK